MIKSPSPICSGVPPLGDDGSAWLRAELMEEVSLLLTLLRSLVRLRLVPALRRQSGLYVRDLAELADCIFTSISAHINKLMLLGVIRAEHDGQMVRYTLLKVEEVDCLEPLLRCSVGVDA